MLAGLCEALFPDRCAACDRYTLGWEGLCGSCAVSLDPLGPACPICAAPQASPVAVVCRRCHLAPPPYARLIAPWKYGGELATGIRRLKYGGARGQGRAEIARALARLLAAALAVASADADLLVPVPLSPGRLRARGFNQTQLLVAHARSAARCPAALALDVLARPTETREQAGLRARDRADNVRGAFAVPAAARLAGRRVLLCDDVVTTGATAAAASRALLRGGAKSVSVLALARAE